MSSRRLEVLEARIGYSFSDRNLLKRALTHRSSSLAMRVEHMERLEFLGDAVLGLVISEFLHDRFPDKPEGELSRMRSALVRKERLFDIAGDWQLIPFLYVGDSERSGSDNSTIKSPSIAANAVEAVIGAVFEDGGWEASRAVVMAAWKAMLGSIGKIDTRDAKSRLQELTQSKGWGLPGYELLDMGAGASPRFEARCYVNGSLFGTGAGERKKIAEAAAAELAWEKLADEQ